MDAEIGRVAEHRADAGMAPLPNHAMHNGINLKVAGNGQQRHRDAGAEVEAEQNAQFAKAAQNGCRNDRQRKPMRRIHPARHAFVVGPQAALRADAEAGRHGRPSQARRQQKQQPGARRTKGQIQDSQQRPQPENNLDERPRIQRLAHHERINAVFGNNERRQQQQNDADANAPKQGPFKQRNDGLFHSPARQPQPFRRSRQDRSLLDESVLERGCR